MTTPPRGSRRTTTTTGGNPNPPVDPIAAAVAQAHRSGLTAWNQMHQQHLNDAAQAGATIVAAGLATTHNRASAPVQVNQDALNAALGVQPVQVAPVQPANNPAGQGANNNTNTNVNVNGGGFFNRMVHRPFALLAGLVLGVIVGLLVYLLVENVASGNGGWAHSGTTELILVILGAIAGAITLDWATQNRTQQGGGVYVVYPNLPQQPPAQPVQQPAAPQPAQPAPAPAPQPTP